MLTSHPTPPTKANFHSTNKLKSRWTETCMVTLSRVLLELHRLPCRAMASDALNSSRSNSISNSPNRPSLKLVRHLYRSNPNTNRRRRRHNSINRSSSNNKHCARRRSFIRVGEFQLRVFNYEHRSFLCSSNSSSSNEPGACHHSVVRACDHQLRVFNPSARWSFLVQASDSSSSKASYLAAYRSTVSLALGSVAAVAEMNDARAKLRSASPSNPRLCARQN